MVRYLSSAISFASNDRRDSLSNFERIDELEPKPMSLFVEINEVTLLTEIGDEKVVLLGRLLCRIFGAKLLTLLELVVDVAISMLVESFRRLETAVLPLDSDWFADVELFIKPRPMPSRAQAKLAKFASRAAATGDFVEPGVKENIGIVHIGQVYPAGAVFGGKRLA